ncbi:MAG: CATRA system-associated protein [Pseudonocardiaceae bacterium]
MEGDMCQDAMDVLQDALSWRLAEGRWPIVSQVVDSLAVTLAAGDIEAFGEAVCDLEQASSVRAVSAQTPPEDPIPGTVRDRINELLHTLEKQDADDEPASTPS